MLKAWGFTPTQQGREGEREERGREVRKEGVEEGGGQKEGKGRRQGRKGSRRMNGIKGREGRKGKEEGRREWKE